MIDYFNCIILPYVVETRHNLGLDSQYPALVLLDYFKGQCAESIFKLLDKNNILYVLVPANCTDMLQPLDLSINKPVKDFIKFQF